MRPRYLIVIVVLLAFPSWAQDDGLTDISAEEWRRLALGKTLTYSVEGKPFALERYAYSGNQVELQFADGECFSGTWIHSGNLFCFDWGFERAHCFRHVSVGGRILIINVVDGEETGSVQEMTKISNAPLACSQNMS